MPFINSMGRRALQLLVVLCFVLGLLPGVGRALAQEGKPRVVRVGYYLATGFQNYDEATKTYSGSSFEYLMAIKQYTGWEYEFVPVDFTDGIKMLEQGQLDLMNNVSKTPERLQTLGFSSYASGANYACLTVEQNNKAYATNDYDSFNTMRIGYIQNSIFKAPLEEFCREHGITPTLVPFKSSKLVQEALDKGTINTRLVSSSYRNSNRIVAKFAPMDYYFAVPKGETELLKQLDQAMMSIKTDMPEFEKTVAAKYEVRPKNKQAVLSATERRFVEKAGAIRVAVDTSWYPVAYMDKDGQPKGALIDLYRKISDATGLVFEFVPYENYDEALAAVANNKTHMISEFPYDFTFAAKYGVELTNIVNDADIFMVVRSSKALGDIKAIAVFHTSYSDEKLHQYYGDRVRYVQYDNLEEAIDAVEDGEVDCAFVNYYAYTRFQNKGHYLNLKTILMPSLNYKFGLGISNKANPLLKSIIAKGLNTIGSSYIEASFQDAAKQQEPPDIEAQYYQNPGLFFLLASVLVGIVVLILGFYYYSKHMKQKNAELERAQKAKNDFLSRMSHDMRTPMNGILGLSYLMEKETSLEAAKGYIPKLQESSRFLLQLINDVLDVNKIESGKMTLLPKVVDERRVFENITELLEPLIAAKHLEFNFIKHNIQWKWMYFDEQRVKQIFINIINNAIKFTPEGGRIDFIMELVKETDTTITDKFIIRDTGCGISKEFMPHLFEPFKQEEGHEMDYQNGTGLGLSIVKQLVELMDGSITVSSEKGKGTEITLFLTFLLAEKPATAEQEPVAGPESKTEAKAGAEVEANTAVANPVAGELQQCLKGLNILLCEDHPLNATIATKLLERQGAKVTWAKDGRLGVEAFAASPIGGYDTVLMDIRMPNMTGLEAAAAIRALPREDAGTVPIIAMSANAYAEDVEKSLAAGMNDHLAKPVDPVLMYKTIMRYAKA